MELIQLPLALAEDMAALHAQAFEAPWDAASLIGLMEGPGVLALGVEDEGALAGFILLRAVAGEAEVLTLAVAPALRRQGLGKALMGAALGLAEALGAQTAFLEVAADNPSAIALYEALGFAQAGRRTAYYRRNVGPAVDAIVLSRDLEGRGA